VISSERCETEFWGETGFAVESVWTDAGGLWGALDGLEVAAFVVPGTLFARLLLS